MRRLPTHLRLVSREEVSWLVVNGLMSAVETDASRRRFERESRGGGGRPFACSIVGRGGWILLVLVAQ